MFDFVKNIERVEFPEALRMLAERAGVALEVTSSTASATSRAFEDASSMKCNAWAEEIFAKQLSVSATVQDYLDQRGLTRQSIERFRSGICSG